MTKAAYRNEPDFNRPVESKIYIGIVKNVIDNQKMGRLEVFIPELGGEQNDRSRWYVVGYASPFAGASNIEANVSGSGNMAGTQTSYGWWAVPPDINNEVLVTFAGGEQVKGFWFACLYQQNMNHMVPEIASNTSNQGGEQGILPPVTEYNKKDRSISPNAPTRPRFEPLHNAFTQQGLYADFQRGPSSTSARRETPSRVMGMLSPRGHSFSIDDNVLDEHIRFRTRSGASITINDTTGFIYFITPRGNSWIELSDIGIDMYTKGSYSVRSELDINMRADRNIVLDAGQNIIATASGNMTMQVGSAFGLTGEIIQVAGDLISQKASTIYRDGMIYDNMGGSGDPAKPQFFARTDKTGEVVSSVSRMPTHEPFDGHPRNDNLTPPIGDVNGASVDITGLGEQRTDVPWNEARTSQEQTVEQTTGEGEHVEVPYDANADSKKINIGAYTITEAVLAAIRRASEVSGVDFGFMMAMAAKESTFNPNAIPINKKTGKVLSSAKGLYQIIDKTWENLYATYGAKYGIKKDRFDPYANALMAAFLTRENDLALKRYKVENRGPTEWYMAHFMGPYPASVVLRGNQNATGVSVAGTDAANANKWVFYDKAGNAKTVRAIVDSFRKYIEPRTIAFRDI